MAPRIVHANGADLCVETFGDPTAPTLLLIAGSAQSMDWWYDGFCERLAAGPRHVIRYDTRDTGASVSYPPGAPGYTGADLIADAVGVLDALGVERAHVLGLSAGGGMAQELALQHPERVASLTLLATSPALPGAADRPPLPPSSEAVRKRYAEPLPEPDWSDREAVIDYLIEDERPYRGIHPVDERERRALVARIVDRTTNIASSMRNVWLIDEPDTGAARLDQIAVPTLVVHGTYDPAFPIEHGEALAREIPGARLLRVDGMGHEVPPKAVWHVVVPALLEHTADP